jgi:hypothetical protein
MSHERANYPTLYDANTNEVIRKATRKEEKASVAAEKAKPEGGGVITIDGRECFVYEKGFH